MAHEGVLTNNDLILKTCVHRVRARIRQHQARVRCDSKIGRNDGDARWYSKKYSDKVCAKQMLTRFGTSISRISSDLIIKHKCQ